MPAIGCVTQCPRYKMIKTFLTQLINQLSKSFKKNADVNRVPHPPLGIRLAGRVSYVIFLPFIILLSYSLQSSVVKSARTCVVLTFG